MEVEYLGGVALRAAAGHGSTESTVIMQRVSEVCVAASQSYLPIQTFASNKPVCARASFLVESQLGGRRVLCREGRQMPARCQPGARRPGRRIAPWGNRTVIGGPNA